MSALGGCRALVRAKRLGHDRWGWPDIPIQENAIDITQFLVMHHRLK